MSRAHAISRAVRGLPIRKTRLCFRGTTAAASSRSCIRRAMRRLSAKAGWTVCHAALHVRRASRKYRPGSAIRQHRDRVFSNRDNWPMKFRSVLVVVALRARRGWHWMEAPPYRSPCDGESDEAARGARKSPACSVASRSRARRWRMPGRCSTASRARHRAAAFRPAPRR